ncbi:MAG: hypothetical protein JST92_21785 [Deltaproteobacteria bacterium]|nr:hypothetical protein [Deltaproteobacteria bacterium]
MIERALASFHAGAYIEAGRQLEEFCAHMPPGVTAPLATAGRAYRLGGDFASARRVYGQVLKVMQERHDEEGVDATAKALDEVVRAETAAGKPLSHFPAATKAEPLVAVLEFKLRKPDQEKPAFTPDTSFLTDVLRTAAADAELQVMTRENVSVLLKLQGYTPSDCVDQCELDTGRMLGADYLITGELSGEGDDKRLSVALHSTSTGRFLSGLQLHGANVSALEADLKGGSAKLFKRLRDEQDKHDAGHNAATTDKPSP